MFSILQLQPIYRLFCSLSLSVLLLSAYTGRDLLHLVGHEHEHSDFHCEVEGIDQHLHQGEIEWHDCLLADFQISPLEQAQDLSWPNPKKPCAPLTQPHFQSCPFSNSDWALPSLRGPPLMA